MNLMPIYRHNIHLIRSSLKYVPRREREQVARDLKPIYTAKDVDHAHAELEAFDEGGRTVPGHHPGMAERLGARDPVPRIPRRGPPRDLHHAIEALNRQPRKAIKTRGSFPNEDAACKLVYLALQNAVPQ